MDLRDALHAAVEAARQAGEILRRDFHRPGGPRGSGDKAEADLEAEAVIRGRLLAAFPTWGYLGEETGAAAGRPGSPVWLVDPNDGTLDYLAGRRGSAVSIGLLGEGRPALGVVYAFAYPDDEGELFAWAEGCGPLLRNGDAVSWTLPPALGEADIVLVSNRGDRDPERTFLCSGPARFRSLCSIAHRLAAVAAGEGAAMSSLTAPGAWDYAAGQALLRPSGGVLVDESGREVGYAPDGRSQTRRAFAGSAAVAAELARRPWQEVQAGPRTGEVPVRLRRGEAVADSLRLARAQGCLLGQMAGASLGRQLEPASEATRGPERLFLKDGGGFLAGQPDGDSELALALGRSILARGGYDRDGALEAYRSWLSSGPSDGAALTEGRSDSSLARVSPLGIFAQALTAEGAAALARDSSPALSDPLRDNAAAALVVALAHAIGRGGGPDGAYRAALGWAREAKTEPPVIQALLAAAERAGDGSEGGLAVLQDAFFELLHAASLEGGVAAAARRGNDSRTRGAIAGALLGAVYGRQAIPAQWRRMVLSCRPHRLRSESPRPPAFWPIDVLELAERLLGAGEAAATAFR